MLISYLAVSHARLRQRHGWKVRLVRESFPPTDTLNVGFQWMLLGLRMALISFPIIVFLTALLEWGLKAPVPPTIMSCLVLVPVVGMALFMAGKMLCLASPVGRRPLLAYWVALHILPLLWIHAVADARLGCALWLVPTTLFLMFLTGLCSHFGWDDLTRRWRNLGGALWVLAAIEGLASVSFADPQVTNAFLAAGALAAVALLWSYVRCLNAVKERLGARAHPLRYREFFGNLWRGLRHGDPSATNRATTKFQPTSYG